MPRAPLAGSILDRAIEALSLALWLDPADSVVGKSLQWAKLTKQHCLTLVPPCR